MSEMRINEIGRCLMGWLARQLPADRLEWLAGRCEVVASAERDRDLYLAIGMVPRRLGKDDLELGAADLAEADRLRPGWDPSGWSVDQAARLVLLLASYRDDATFVARLETLFNSSDVGESVAFYRGLPIYPGGDRLVARAKEGIRTNIKSVFEAVAHRNPYPRERFDEGAWNQMILKALFIGSVLHPVQGVDERANPALTRMLCLYAHERWAASRPVRAELWRSVGACLDDGAVADLRRVLGSADARVRAGGVLALRGRTDPRAAALLAEFPVVGEEVARGGLTWEDLCED